MEIESFDFREYVRERVLSRVEESFNKFKEKILQSMKNALRIAEFYLDSPLAREYYNIRRFFLKEINNSGFYKLYLEYDKAPSGLPQDVVISRIFLHGEHRREEYQIILNPYDYKDYERYYHDCLNSINIDHLAERIARKVRDEEEWFDKIIRDATNLDGVVELDSVPFSNPEVMLERFKEFQTRRDSFLINLYKKSIESDPHFKSYTDFFARAESKFALTRGYEIFEDEDLLEISLTHVGYFRLKKIIPYFFCKQIERYVEQEWQQAHIPFLIENDSSILNTETYMRKIDAKIFSYLFNGVRDSVLLKERIKELIAINKFTSVNKLEIKIEIKR